MKKDSKILITGSSGMVGKALVKKLQELGFNNILTPIHEEMNLVNQTSTEKYFNDNYPIRYVFHLAAVVGGIQANIDSPIRFLEHNLLINCNIIQLASSTLTTRLINLGSSCIYPTQCKQPMKEEYLLDGKPEPTNEGYALAKICGLKLCEYYKKQFEDDFITLIPPNMYGPGDHFEKNRSHVISALITKMHKAKMNGDRFVKVWGSGEARREFLYVDDCVDVMIYFMQEGCDEPYINIGCGEDISIADLACLIKKVVGYTGVLVFEGHKPEGMKKKLLDSSKSKTLGWTPKTKLEKGLEKTYRWYCNNDKS